jgi:tetratricopeptide (TPR) repeat protein
LAATLLAISSHENRSRRDFYLNVASNLISIVFNNEPGFLPATIMLLRVKAENKAFTVEQLNANIATILKENVSSLNAKSYRDLARIKMERNDFDNDLGAISLLQQSLEMTPTAEAYHLLGKAHYLKWYKDKSQKKRYVKRSLTLAIKSAGMNMDKLPDLVEETETERAEEPETAITEQAGLGSGILTANTMGETEMLQLVREYFESAAKRCYNSNLETLLELGIVCGKLEEFPRSRDLLKRAVTSEDSSIQERGYRHLAIFDQRTDLRVTETYLREAIARQHFVKLTDSEKEEFWEKVFAHAEGLLELDKGHHKAFPWIRDLVDARYHRADILVELHNKESTNPISGLNGEVPASNNVKKINSRKQSKSRMNL